MDVNAQNYIYNKVELIIDTLNLQTSDSKFLEDILTQIYDTGYQEGEADAIW